MLTATFSINGDLTLQRPKSELNSSAKHTSIFLHGHFGVVSFGNEIGEDEGGRGEEECFPFFDSKIPKLPLHNRAHALHVRFPSTILTGHPLLDKCGTRSKLWGCFCRKKKDSGRLWEKL